VSEIFSFSHQQCQGRTVVGVGCWCWLLVLIVGCWCWLLVLVVGCRSAHLRVTTSRVKTRNTHTWVPTKYAYITGVQDIFQEQDEDDT
jgi:hypothetical protein